MQITAATMRRMFAAASQWALGGSATCGSPGVLGPVIALGSYGLNVLASFTEVSTCGAFSVTPSTSTASAFRPLAAASTYLVSQPGGVFVQPSSQVGTAIVPDTRIKAHEGPAPVVNVPEGATVADLLEALRAIRLPTRDVIAVLQSIKAAGALDGELVIQ